jgi:hypothetical protein
LLARPPKVQETKAEIDKWDYSKLKCFWIAMTLSIELRTFR